jgi:hypothetical protein
MGVHTYQLVTNNELNQWRRAFLGKLTVIQQVKKRFAFYGTRMFITIFTEARQIRGSV